MCCRAAESCQCQLSVEMTSLMTHQHKKTKQWRTVIPCAHTHTRTVILISLAQHTHTQSLTNQPHKCVSFWQQMRPACVSVYKSLLLFYPFYTATMVSIAHWYWPILAFMLTYAIYQCI